MKTPSSYVNCKGAFSDLAFSVQSTNCTRVYVQCADTTLRITRAMMEGQVMGCFSRCCLNCCHRARFSPVQRNGLK